MRRGSGTLAESEGGGGFLERCERVPGGKSRIGSSLLAGGTRGADEDREGKRDDGGPIGREITAIDDALGLSNRGWIGIESARRPWSAGSQRERLWGSWG